MFIASRLSLQNAFYIAWDREIYQTLIGFVQWLGEQLSAVMTIVYETNALIHHSSSSESSELERDVALLAGDPISECWSIATIISSLMETPWIIALPSCSGELNFERFIWYSGTLVPSLWSLFNRRISAFFVFNRWQNLSSKRFSWSSMALCSSLSLRVTFSVLVSASSNLAIKSVCIFCCVETILADSIAQSKRESCVYADVSRVQNHDLPRAYLVLHMDINWAQF